MLLRDKVAINLLAVGADEPLGNTVTLIGEEIFVVNDLNVGVHLPLALRR